ncbi:unnamed protein product, partial [Protopolystoma xenopodis]
MAENRNDASLHLVTKHLSLASPFPHFPEYPAHFFQQPRLPQRHYVLVEASSSRPDGAKQPMERLLLLALDQKFCIDGAQAMNESQSKYFWSLRHNIALASKRAGSFTLKYDVSLPVEKLPLLVGLIEEVCYERYPYLHNSIAFAKSTN